MYSEDVTERLFSALEFPLGKKAVGKEELCDYSDILGTGEVYLHHMGDVQPDRGGD